VAKARSTPRGFRRLRFTREGRWFVAITIGIGFAAVNTGNNLLYLVLGWLMSAIVVSGVLSEQALRKLVVTRRPPARVHAGRPFLMGIALENRKRRLPSFSIEIEDIVAGKPLDKKCFFLKVPAGKAQETRYRHTFSRRGLYRFDGVRVSTKFPFALFLKARHVELPGEVLVVPAIQPVTPPLAPNRTLGDDPRARLGRRGDFYGLRERRDGDEVRDIHWPSTARSGRIMVREYEEETHRRINLFVDNSLAPAASEADEEGLERAISLAASLAAHYLGRGYGVRLIARGEAVPAGGGPGQLARILKTLARLPTVPPDITFAGVPELAAQSVLVTRKGARPERLPAGVASVIEAA
jgi:uncharacterized protein (DUF58 family)